MQSQHIMLRWHELQLLDKIRSTKTNQSKTNRMPVKDTWDYNNDVWRYVNSETAPSHNSRMTLHHWAVGSVQQTSGSAERWHKNFRFCHCGSDQEAN